MSLAYRAPPNETNVVSARRLQAGAAGCAQLPFRCDHGWRPRGQSGRQETDGRSTPQAEEHGLPGADGWGESSENKCRLNGRSAAASIQTQATFLDVTS